VDVRGPAVIVVVSLASAVAVILLADPEQPWAVAMLVAALGLAVGAGAFGWQLRSPGGRRGRRGPRPRRADVLRRAAGIGAIAALLLWLRAVDGLSILTAAFVIGSFVLAELVLTTSLRSSR
jgi:hypothetical protein